MHGKDSILTKESNLCKKPKVKMLLHLETVRSSVWSNLWRGCGEEGWGGREKSGNEGSVEEGQRSGHTS